MSRLKTLGLLMLVTVFTSFLYFGNNYSYAQSNDETKPSSKILYTINAGHDRYFIHFNVCAGNETLTSSQILIVSDLETKQMFTSKVIYEYTCRNFETIIHAKYPNLIKILVN